VLLPSVFFGDRELINLKLENIDDDLVVVVDVSAIVDVPSFVSVVTVAGVTVAEAVSSSSFLVGPGGASLSSSFGLSSR
jgi:hypothetical protein